MTFIWVITSVCTSETHLEVSSSLHYLIHAPVNECVVLKREFGRLMFCFNYDTLIIYIPYKVAVFKFELELSCFDLLKNVHGKRFFGFELLGIGITYLIYVVSQRLALYLVAERDERVERLQLKLNWHKSGIDGFRPSYFTFVLILLIWKISGEKFLKISTLDNCMAFWFAVWWFLALFISDWCLAGYFKAPLALFEL